MSLKTFLGRSLAIWVNLLHDEWQRHPDFTQRRLLKKLVKKAQHTVFGREHDFKSIKTYQDFKERVPIRHYENFTGYIRQIKEGLSDVLWPGRPMYFAKTSGTTGGDKYIPITQESLRHQIINARNALLYYIFETGKTEFIEKKMLFLSGSPQLVTEGGIPTGRLSGIVNHHIPTYIQQQHLPSYETNCIPDWEAKLDKIVEETLQAKANLGLISGIPPWVQMYFDKLQQKTGKLVGELFPDFSVLVHGGVNFQPYWRKIFESIGREVDTIETYPASEGFIAFQNSRTRAGLLLQANSGMFFEFVPTKTLNTENPIRLTIDQVSIGVDYALILSTNAGLWSYALGDTIKFISLTPPKIIVTGRTKHFISAFGEHVIIEEIERAMEITLKRHPSTRITEFTVAPWVSTQAGEPSYHEWLIEFSNPPEDLNTFAYDLSQRLCYFNMYYKDLIQGNILSNPKVTPLVPGAFRDYMREIGKLGEQNKVIRVSNDRKIADALSKYKIASV